MDPDKVNRSFEAMVNNFMNFFHGEFCKLAVNGLIQ